jgi:hypothetical protein
MKPNFQIDPMDDRERQDETDHAVLILYYLLNYRCQHLTLTILSSESLSITMGQVHESSLFLPALTVTSSNTMG